jgi:hypothetical protein
MVAVRRHGRVRRVWEGGISIVIWDSSNRVAMQNYGNDHRADLGRRTALITLNGQDSPHLGCAVPWCQTS